MHSKPYAHAQYTLSVNTAKPYTNTAQLFHTKWNMPNKAVAVCHNNGMNQLVWNVHDILIGFLGNYKFVAPAPPTPSPLYLPYLPIPPPYLLIKCAFVLGQTDIQKHVLRSKSAM